MMFKKEGSISINASVGSNAEKILKEAGYEAVSGYSRPAQEKQAREKKAPQIDSKPSLKRQVGYKRVCPVCSADFRTTSKGQISCSRSCGKKLKMLPK